MTIPRERMLEQRRAEPPGPEPVNWRRRVRVTSRRVPIATARQDGSEQATTLSIVRRSYGYHGVGRHFKRAIDVVATVLALPILLPIVVPVMVGIVVSSPGNPCFRQERVGQGGRRFKCLKFRTMYRDAEARLMADPDLYERYRQNDYKLPLAEDPRIFPLGRFLRSSSLDELPQFLNVLAGSMSLVGPRPVVPKELRLYGPLVDAYLAAVPGITGPWQTTGRNRIRYPERARLDADYIEHWSLWTDLTILARTIPSVLRRDGSH